MQDPAARENTTTEHPMNAEQSSSESTGRAGPTSAPVPAAEVPDSSGTRPLLPRGLLIIVGIASAPVAAAGLRAFSDVVAPVFLGLVLSITVQPLRRLPARHGLP